MGKTYPLFGAREMSFPEMAVELGRLLGKPIQYRQVDVPDPESNLQRTMAKSSATFSGSIFLKLPLTTRKGVFAGTNDLVESIGGKPPMTFEAFVEKHRRELTA